MQNTTVPVFTSTNEAHAYGHAATPAQLAQLESRRHELRDLYFVGGKTIDEKFTIAFQLQFCREAIEAANSIAPTEAIGA